MDEGGTTAGVAVGRITAAEDRRFNEYYGGRIGVFGFLACPESLPLPLSPMVMPLSSAPGWQSL